MGCFWRRSWGGGLLEGEGGERERCDEILRTFYGLYLLVATLLAVRVRLNSGTKSLERSWRRILKPSTPSKGATGTCPFGWRLWRIL